MQELGWSVLCWGTGNGCRGWWRIGCGVWWGGSDIASQDCASIGNDGWKCLEDSFSAARASFWCLKQESGTCLWVEWEGVGRVIGSHFHVVLLGSYENLIIRKERKTYNCLCPFRHHWRCERHLFSVVCDKCIPVVRWVSILLLKSAPNASKLSLDSTFAILKSNQTRDNIGALSNLHRYPHHPSYCHY